MAHRTGPDRDRVGLDKDFRIKISGKIHLCDFINKIP